MRSPEAEGGFGLGLRSGGGKFLLGQSGWQAIEASPARNGGPRARVALLASGGQRGGHVSPAGPSRPAAVAHRRASGGAQPTPGGGGGGGKAQAVAQPPLPPPLPADKAAAAARAATPSQLGGAAGRAVEGPFSLQAKAGSRAGGNGCNCKQSKCLKLYCVCFARGGVCGPGCQCVTCHNKDAHSEEVRVRCSRGGLGCTAAGKCEAHSAYPPDHPTAPPDPGPDRPGQLQEAGGHPVPEWRRAGVQLQAEPLPEEVLRVLRGACCWHTSRLLRMRLNTLTRLSPFSRLGGSAPPPASA